MAVQDSVRTPKWSIPPDSNRGLIRTKTEATTFSTIGLSILATNLFKILARVGRFIFVFFKLLLQPENYRLEGDMYQECTC
jgi:hypothetical protein